MLLYKSPLGETAGQRLAMMERTEDGFQIAEKDLELRGGGEILGARQSGAPGFRVAEVPGFEMLLTAARDDAVLVLANDPGLAHNDGRVARTEEIEKVIADWVAAHSLAEVLAVLERADVPSGKIYDIADIAADAHYAARDMIREHRLPDGAPIKLPGIVPKMSGTPGQTRWIGPELGAHTAEVLGALGYSDEQQKELKRRGVT